MANLDDEYELSERSEHAFTMMWPDTLTVAHPLFQTRMYELQIRLIEGHMNTMFAADKRRAVNTIRHIRTLMKQHDAEVQECLKRR